MKTIVKQKKTLKSINHKKHWH